ncbi:MAG: DNA polymerase III subunit alpha [Burkholderiaceae bacterium]|jgi:DNA polymerase-3 subunit alpha|nr:DNA polymerase III subunit alpha [Burkholderiaceae bacterium]
MSSPAFVHLRLHSEFSVVDGVVRIDDVIKAAAADAQGALALTDAGNMFGAVRFYKAARAGGVKPILGVDAWVSNDTDRDRPYRLLLLAADRTGYLNLCELLSRAWLQNPYRGRGELRPEWLAELNAGLIALSGAAGGEVGALLLGGKRAAAVAAAQQLAQWFPQRFYLELQRAGRDSDEPLVKATVALARELSLPVVATQPVQYLAAEDFRAHEARVCIAEGETLSDPRRPQRFTREQYFKSQAQMAALFADIPAALANSVEIARRCNLELTLGKPRLPDYPTPEGVTLDAHCADLSAQGLEKRLAALYADESARTEARPRYTQRLAFELEIIAKMGFSGYFLIVADFINWAKNNGIPVGPGRGSGAGSLVAYSLGITDLDPLKYDLLFERFLNPERVSMPDFDIDFCQDNRDKVIDYVKRKYGAQAVSQIATFGTLGAKAVVRDVGRVLDMPYTKCDQLSKLIPHNPADPWTLDRALEQEPAFAEAVNNDEENQQLVELARPLEGLTRNVGMHAGGVLIAPGKLTDFCPLYAQNGQTEYAVSQFDKDDVEAIGLVKFDFLGLTTLTILDLTLAYVRRLDPDFSLTLETLPLDDAKAYDIFKRADTAAIFQFESRGMRELLKRARPDRLEDLIALNALYRPGPMDLIPDYIERKHGRQRVEYLHPSIEPILSETYGIMVYQEQVMRIAQEVGAYSLGSADLLRRAMGKKKPEEMAKQRTIFVDGARSKAVDENVATELFDLMEKFAGYGFNKSHSAAYALVAYQTAYFKAHHAAAFMAANLTAVMDDTDKVKELIEDCKAIGLTIEAPNVNLGEYRFEPVDAKTVRYGLGGVKGTGRGAIEAIIAARSQGGPFTSLFDFCARVEKGVVNRRVVEALVRAGGFDALDADRAKLFNSVGRALEAAEKAAADIGQESLFGGLLGDGGGSAPQIDYVPSRPWSERERLAAEKLALGYYFSGHLFTEYAAEARRLAPTRLADVKGGNGRDTLRLAGIIVSARTQNTKRGRMGVIMLDDGSAQLELMVYSETFDRRRAILKEDTLVFVSGRVREFDGRISVSAEDVMDLAEARAKAQASLRLDMEPATDIARLKSLLAPYRIDANGNGNHGNGLSGCRVLVSYRNGVGTAELAFSEAWRVRPDDALLTELKQQATVRAAVFAYG